MQGKKSLTEARLHEALNRLLNGKPTRVKTTGKLTLNKINNEAGLGNSYVHKFHDFIAYANPIIAEFNEEKRKLVEEGFSISDIQLTELEKLKAEKKRERQLKEKYKHERDDARKAKVELEALNNSLMFRLYELQEELAHIKGTVIEKNLS
ncbi:hypothetical protein [Vibrio pelagius]|uniref:hypothetical protein n=1 Tax=Vibrio pelagius TaxID=28169 RepID=UPI0021C39975|nr:hypothetical protein [Vibrio pelagius]